MQVASWPAGQQPPIAVLRGPADTAPPGGGAELGELAGLAARACAAPVALITHHDRVAAGHGLAAPPWHRVDPARLAAVPESPAADHPLVSGAPGVRFAARVPMVGTDGTDFGTLVLLDREPRELTALQRDLLHTIAGRAAGLLELAHVRRRLAELDGAADAFVGLISHEMRTPLAAVCGYLELLTDVAELPPAQVRRFHEAIDRNSRRLLRMVDDMMLLSRIGSTGLLLTPGPVDLVPLTMAALTAVSATAAGKGVLVGSELAGAAWLAGEAPKLRQAVDHLIGNAVKFTPGGGRVSVRVTVGPPVTLHITDTGVGIPRDEHARLFDRFFRGTAAETEEVPGAGLGLSVTKAILDAHGATMTVTGRPGRGTSVTVTFGGGA